MPNSHAPLSHSAGPLPLSYLAFIAAHGRMLAFGFLLTLFSSFGQTFFISLSGGYIREEFGLTNAEFGLLYSIATLGSATALIWAGRWIDTTGLRRYVTAVCLALAAACIGMATAGHAVLLVLALLIIATLWHVGVRHGPLQAPASRARRQLEEHLRGSADFLLRRSGQHSLLKGLQQDIHRRARRRAERDEQGSRHAAVHAASGDPAHRTVPPAEGRALNSSGPGTPCPASAGRRWPGAGSRSCRRR